MTTAHIQEYFGRHRGQKAVALGNGPTLSKYDLRALSEAGYMLIGMNKSWTQGPAYYHTYVAHPHFTDQCEGKFSPGQWFGETWRPGVLFTTSGILDEGKRRKLNWDGTVVPIRQAGRVCSETWFSADMNRGHHSPFAGCMAIELALWMQFDELYLLGYDCHNNEGHHFDPDNHNFVVERKRQKLFLRSVAKYAEKTRTKVFNATPGSAIESFPFKLAEEGWKGETVGASPLITSR